MSDRLGFWIGMVLILLIGVACAPVTSPTLAPPPPHLQFSLFPIPIVSLFRLTAPNGRTLISTR